VSKQALPAIHIVLPCMPQRGPRRSSSLYSAPIQPPQHRLNDISPPLPSGSGGHYLSLQIAWPAIHTHPAPITPNKPAAPTIPSRIFPSLPLPSPPPPLRPLR
jgi:hypothetical protein